MTALELKQMLSVYTDKELENVDLTLNLPCNQLIFRLNANFKEYCNLSMDTLEFTIDGSMRCLSKGKDYEY